MSGAMVGSSGSAVGGLGPVVFESGGSVGRRLVGRSTGGNGGGGSCGSDVVVGAGGVLDPESGMRAVSSVTPWGSAAAIGATEAAYRAVDEVEG